jgi:hypothetical protein
VKKKAERGYNGRKLRAKIFSRFDFHVFTSVPRSHAQKRALFPIAFFVLKSRFYYPLCVVGSVFLHKREGKKGEQKQGEKEEEEDNVLVFLMAEKRRGRLEEDK